MSEVWRDIPGYEGQYQVSNGGHVRNARTQRVLRPGVAYNGYYMVRLCKNGYALTQRVPRLVASAFVPGFAPGLQVNHKNGDKTDNRAVNLEWCTPSENQLHRFHVLRHHGTGKKAVKCVDTGDVYSSITEAAKDIGVSVPNLSRVLSGRRKTIKKLHFKFVGKA